MPKWWIKTGDGKVNGPLTEEELIETFAGMDKLDHIYCRSGGQSNWRPISKSQPYLAHVNRSSSKTTPQRIGTFSYLLDEAEGAANLETSDNGEHSATTSRSTLGDKMSKTRASTTHETSSVSISADINKKLAAEVKILRKRLRGADVDGWAKQLHMAQREIQRLSRRIEELENAVQIAADQACRYEQEKEDLQVEIAALEHSLSKRNLEIQGNADKDRIVLEEAQELKNENTRLREASQADKATIQRLEAENRKRRFAHQLEQEEISQKLENEMLEHKIKASGWKNQIEAQKSRIKELENKLQDTHSSLSEQIQQEAENHQRAKERAEKAQTESLRYQDKLKQMEEEHAKKVAQFVSSVSSLAGPPAHSNGYTNPSEEDKDKSIAAQKDPSNEVSLNENVSIPNSMDPSELTPQTVPDDLPDGPDFEESVSEQPRVQSISFENESISVRDIAASRPYSSLREEDIKKNLVQKRIRECSQKIRLLSPMHLLLPSVFVFLIVMMVIGYNKVSCNPAGSKLKEGKATFKSETPTNSELTFKMVVEKWPTSLEAKKAQDYLACLKARKGSAYSAMGREFTGTLPGWNKYLEKYPKGVCSGEAADFKRKLDEDTREIQGQLDRLEAKKREEEKERKRREAKLLPEKRALIQKFENVVWKYANNCETTKKKVLQSLRANGMSLSTARKYWAKWSRELDPEDYEGDQKVIVEYKVLVMVGMITEAWPQVRDSSILSEKCKEVLKKVSQKALDNCTKTGRSKRTRWIFTSTLPCFGSED